MIEGSQRCPDHANRRGLLPPLAPLERRHTLRRNRCGYVGAVRPERCTTVGVFGALTFFTISFSLSCVMYVCRDAMAFCSCSCTSLNLSLSWLSGVWIPGCAMLIALLVWRASKFVLDRFAFGGTD